jgi:hypothetical protein
VRRSTGACRAVSYPIIVSIENHCSSERRTVMAQMFVEIFGGVGRCERADERTTLCLVENLLQSPLSPDETRLPSPNQLRRKIILKVLLRRASNDTMRSLGSSVTRVVSFISFDLVESNRMRKQRQPRAQSHRSRSNRPTCHRRAPTLLFNCSTSPNRLSRVRAT